jgi:hypothetical protein
MNAHTEGRAGQMLEVLRAMCGNAATPSLVEQYFAPGPFAGRTFIDLAPNDPYRIGEADLLAVTLLDVSFPPASVRWFLDRTNRSTLSDLLRALPSPASELHALEREALAGADGLWRLFARHEAPPGTTFTGLDEELRGVGPVKADKLDRSEEAGHLPDLRPCVRRALRARGRVRLLNQKLLHLLLLLQSYLAPGSTARKPAPALARRPPVV